MRFPHLKIVLPALRASHDQIAFPPHFIAIPTPGMTQSTIIHFLISRSSYESFLPSINLSYSSKLNIAVSCIDPTNGTIPIPRSRRLVIAVPIFPSFTRSENPVPVPYAIVRSPTPTNPRRAHLIPLVSLVHLSIVSTQPKFFPVVFAWINSESQLQDFVFFPIDCASLSVRRANFSDTFPLVSSTSLLYFSRAQRAACFFSVFLGSASHAVKVSSTFCLLSSSTAQSCSASTFIASGVVWFATTILCALFSYTFASTDLNTFHPFTHHFIPSLLPMISHGVLTDFS